MRDIIDGKCSCTKWGTVGFNWVKFGLKTGIIDGYKWVDRVKEKPYCRN